MPNLDVDRTKNAQDQLFEWGKWCRAEGNRLSYPNMTPYAKLQARHGVSLAITDEEAQEIDSVVCELKESAFPAYNLAIEYFVKGKSFPKIQRELKISSAKAQMYRDQVVFYVKGRLYPYSV